MLFPAAVELIDRQPAQPAPVAAYIALRNGRSPITPVSPIPPGASPLLITCLDLRHLVDAQHAVVVEVGLLVALLDDDLAVRAAVGESARLRITPRSYQD